jgi:hypothetical protein
MRSAAFALFAGVLTLAVASLVSSYYAYYDIGINTAANSFFLFYCVAPISFAVLIGSGLLSDGLLARLTY